MLQGYKLALSIYSQHNHEHKTFFMASHRHCVVGSLGNEGSQVGDTANVIVSGKDNVAQNAEVVAA